LTISVDTGKVLDYESMSRYCQVCNVNKKVKQSDPVRFEEIKAAHQPDGKLNHKGSAPPMEQTGTKHIFQRSTTKHKLRYIKLLGDGDTKSLSAVENTYPGIKVKKLECVGHVQKRVGNRLRKLKAKVKGLGGRGRLTDSLIDKLENYYGIAIRRNVGDLVGMKKAIHATLFHVISSSTTPHFHVHCPTR